MKLDFPFYSYSSLLVQRMYSFLKKQCYFTRNNTVAYSNMKSPGKSIKISYQNRYIFIQNNILIFS